MWHEIARSLVVRLKTVLASDGKLRSKGNARRQSRTADARRATSPRRMLEMLEPRLAMAAELIDTVSFGGQSLGT
ncbi:MAG TPA: hypothetical protein PLV92_15480, partial [Pirellulaceae bacterium]|nr:hypothetical protein [Pirellulaceae bacterium]